MSLSLSDLRQSAAELLACAVVDVFPGALMVDSSATEFGFYYEFIAEQPIDDHALVLLEEKMRGLIKGSLEVRTLDMMRENAAGFFEHRGQPFIAQRVLDARDNIVSIFQLGEFHDYCPFPLIAQTDEIGAFKLLKVESTTHFFPEEGDVPVIRIRGTAFRDPQALKKFLKTRERSRKKDHRSIAKELDLFALHEGGSDRAWFWHHKGAVLREILLDWWRLEHRQQQFLSLVTPPFLKDELLQKSGFYDQAVESEYPPAVDVQDVDYVMPPALTPAHGVVYASKSRLYSDLPLRYAECAWISNKDKKKPLWGILNADFTYADFAHIFCAPSQVENELISSLQFIDKIIKIFSFEYHWCLKAQGQKFAGSPARWKKGLDSLVSAFNKSGLNYSVDPAECSYNGPMAEACIVDSFGREWKGPSLGFDFVCPQRLKLSYQDVNHESQIPLLLVRSLFGSIERFAAILIEHYGGMFPLWLAPEQVRVISLGDGNNEYVKGVYAAIAASGYRVKLDGRTENLGAKIHAAESEKIPYMIIVGEKEEKQNLITVRSSNRELTQGVMTLDAFLKQVHEMSSKIPHEVGARKSV